MASADEEVAVTDEVIVLKILLTVLFFVCVFCGGLSQWACL